MKSEREIEEGRGRGGEERWAEIERGEIMQTNIIH